MPVVCMLNQKGGVGKTSTCFHLSGTLAQLGRRVLLDENDPQASLTQGFLGPDVMGAIGSGEPIASIYAGDDPLPSQVIRAVRPRIDLLAGSRRARKYNLPEPQAADPEVQGCLRAFLGEVRDEYDAILIDCPPNLELCSWAALLAADNLVIPLNPEDFGAQGIAEVLDAVDLVLAGPNPRLHLAGYLVTRMNARASVHKLYESRLRESYGSDVFATVIPNSVDYLESNLKRQPVSEYKPKGAAAKAMKALADELDSRLAVRRAA